MQRGFTALGLQRVVATTYEHNLASRRVMEKLGMRLVRTFRLQELNQDTAHLASLELWDGNDVEYALEKAAWMGQRPDQARCYPQRADSGTAA